jgi:hypothetical protein
VRSGSSFSAATLSAVTLLALAGCRDRFPDGPVDGGTTDDAGALTCTIEAPTDCTDPTLRWADISPIIQLRCSVCHNTQVVGSQWPLMQYSHVADWSDLVRSMLADCSMPPPDAGVPMSDEERLKILTWIRCGYPE